MSDTARPDRASRDLMAALDQTRPRTAADAADPSVPVAGTVLLLRDGATGPTRVRGWPVRRRAWARRPV
ncbi:MAG: hypothetical protein J0I44_02960 [Microbacterium sp.]|nr:hypothetical protein [Microbacterium sp.]